MVQSSQRIVPLDGTVDTAHWSVNSAVQDLLHKMPSGSRLLSHSVTQIDCDPRDGRDEQGTFDYKKHGHSLLIVIFYE